MSAHNFWHNFTHGFMHGMFNSNPFFGCWGGFGPMWGNPFMFGGGFSSFNPLCNTFFPPVLSWNSSVFAVPDVMAGGFYPLMPDIQPMEFNNNMNFDINRLFTTENVWENWNKQIQNNQNVLDTFVKTPPLSKTKTNETYETYETYETHEKQKENGIKAAAITPKTANKITSSPPAKPAKMVNTPAAAGREDNIQSTKLTDEFTGTAKQLNKMLNKKDGVLKNKGRVFLDAQERYGINAAVLAAICILESDYGTSRLARTKNNVGGVSKGLDFRSYNSVDECIMDMARFLKSGYINKGLVTINQVGKKYCPVGDPRDTKGLNAGWSNAVTDITRKLETLA